jgi:hypothetical protein
MPARWCCWRHSVRANRANQLEKPVTRLPTSRLRESVPRHGSVVGSDSAAAWASVRESPLIVNKGMGSNRTYPA